MRLVGLNFILSLSQGKRKVLQIKQILSNHIHNIVSFTSCKLNFKDKINLVVTVGCSLGVVPLCNSTIVASVPLCNSTIIASVPLCALAKKARDELQSRRYAQFPISNTIVMTQASLIRIDAKSFHRLPDRKQLEDEG